MSIIRHRTILPASTFSLLFILAVLSSGFCRAEDEVEKKLNEAGQAIENEDSAKAIEILDGLIAADPKLAVAIYLRGRERFKLGLVKESVADFDRYVELRPDHKSRQWERGISLYYAERFKDGADQFALYQTFHDSDVENSVWRYLCMARDEDVAAARKSMLEIKNDTRVPMMEIYEMYRGNSTPEKVLTAARAGEPNEAQLKRHLFYAHLYIGLFHEAQGEKELAEKHLQAAADHKIDHYMWNVADVHVKRLSVKE